MLSHTTNLDFRMTKRNAMPGAEKALQGLIPVPEGTFQLETGISNPRALTALSREAKVCFVKAH